MYKQLIFLKNVQNIQQMGNDAGRYHIAVKKGDKTNILEVGSWRGKRLEKKLETRQKSEFYKEMLSDANSYYQVLDNVEHSWRPNYSADAISHDMKAKYSAKQKFEPWALHLSKLEKSHYRNVYWGTASIFGGVGVFYASQNLFLSASYVFVSLVGAAIDGHIQGKNNYRIANFIRDI